MFCLHQNPERVASSLAEPATKPKTGLNSVVGFISKYARMIGLHQKTCRFYDMPPLAKYSTLIG
jgi:hypothetical protein